MSATKPKKTEPDLKQQTEEISQELEQYIHEQKSKSTNPKDQEAFEALYQEIKKANLPHKVKDLTAIGFDTVTASARLIRSLGAMNGFLSTLEKIEISGDKTFGLAKIVMKALNGLTTTEDDYLMKGSIVPIIEGCKQSLQVKIDDYNKKIASLASPEPSPKPEEKIQLEEPRQAVEIPTPEPKPTADSLVVAQASAPSIPSIEPAEPPQGKKEKSSEPTLTKPKPDPVKSPVAQAAALSKFKKPPKKPTPKKEEPSRLSGIYSSLSSLFSEPSQSIQKKSHQKSKILELEKVLEKIATRISNTDFLAQSIEEKQSQIDQLIATIIAVKLKHSELKGKNAIKPIKEIIQKSKNNVAQEMKNYIKFLSDPLQLDKLIATLEKYKKACKILRIDYNSEIQPLLSIKILVQDYSAIFRMPFDDQKAAIESKAQEHAEKYSILGKAIIQAAAQEALSISQSPAIITARINDARFLTSYTYRQNTEQMLEIYNNTRLSYGLDILHLTTEIEQKKDTAREIFTKKIANDLLKKYIEKHNEPIITDAEKFQEECKSLDITPEQALGKANEINASLTKEHDEILARFADPKFMSDAKYRNETMEKLIKFQTECGKRKIDCSALRVMGYNAKQTAEAQERKPVKQSSGWFSFWPPAPKQTESKHSAEQKSEHKEDGSKQRDPPST